MSSRNLLYAASLTLFSLLFIAASPSFADSSHIRIIRLSLVQGQVRFARDVKGDPMASPNVTWENAELNLPIRQGYVLATDNGRAEIEFENGSMAFLSSGSVLEFYDLSLEDGAKTTRLILRQGSASFYVNPANGDYFSVTGGDFSVEADGHSSFRLDNFDDGSVVNVMKGHVSVLRKNQATALVKGQSLSMRANDSGSVSIGHLTENDDFDRWVAGRTEMVTAATNAAQPYVNSSGYSSGLASLYTYGGWYPCAGYGNCWQPYGVGAGWSPFNSGFWFSDPSIGLSFIGDQPWGWLPYHYGGWIFNPTLGWMWSPYGLGGGGVYAPVTGIWLHSKTGPIGIVPVHPLDARGKTPINLANGVFPVSEGAISSRVPVSAGDEWKPVKNIPRNTLATNTVAAAPPERVSRTLVGGTLSAHVVTLDRNSSIAYDASEHRFVNTNAIAADSGAHAQNGVVAAERATGKAGLVAVPSNTAAMRATPGTSVPARASLPAPRAMTPPPAPRSAEYGRSGPSVGGGFDATSRSTSATSSAAPHASAAASSASSGARPH
jgi:hypothetical protein